jgi:hypothetical protein
VPGDRLRDDLADRRPAPDLGATGAAMREEWRAEQDAAIDDAAEQWRHSRTLLDLARDHMHRGDRVAVIAAGHRAVGEIVEVAPDRIALADHDARVDVHVVESVPLAFQVVERARSGGRSATRAGTFRARLLELEAAGAPVVITATTGTDRFNGTLGVGTDLVVITSISGIETVIALSAVASVAPTT